jgi:elongation factor P--(R)-beta-lysine ligase
MVEPWWRPARHQARRAGLLTRNRVKSALRAHFEAEGFIEVEAAALQISPGNETHLHAFATEAVSPAAQRQPLYLHTSPEFALKKLLAAGERKVFDFARVFRNREDGVRHAREFVMLEWYRAEEDYAVLMADCAKLVCVAAEAAGASTLRHGDRSADPFAVPERLSVTDAFDRFAGIHLQEILTESGLPIRDAFAQAAVDIGVRVAPDDNWSDVFSRVMAERVEPQIGNGRVTILYDYPLPEAALARPKSGELRVAERFEMFACGLELANAFGELRDVDEQRRRFEADMAEKARLYGERYPIDDDFLAALAVMPEASGCALGFDRLLMLLLGAPDIADVQWTPPRDAGS